MHARWFKSVFTYSFTLEEPDAVTLQTMIEGCEKLKHKPIQPSQKECHGFSSIMGYRQIDKVVLVHPLQNGWLLSVMFEEKKLNKRRFNRIVAEEKRKLAEQKNIPVSDITKPEIKAIEERIRSQLLADVEAQEEYTNIIIAREKNRIYFSDSNQTRQKKVLDLLSKIMPGFKATAFDIDGIEVQLSAWLSDPARYLPEEVDLSDSARLEAIDNSKASLTKQSLISEEMQVLLSHGKKAVELCVNYMGRLEFKLTSFCHVKSIKVLDVLKDSIDRDEEVESLLQDYEADWLVMIAEFNSLFDWLETVKEQS